MAKEIGRIARKVISDGGRQGMRNVQRGVVAEDGHVGVTTAERWYAYCKGDPVNRMDPSELDDIEVDEGNQVHWVTNIGG